FDDRVERFELVAVVWRSAFEDAVQRAGSECAQHDAVLDRRERDRRRRRYDRARESIAARESGPQRAAAVRAIDRSVVLLTAVHAIAIHRIAREIVELPRHEALVVICGLRPRVVAREHAAIIRDPE